MFKIGTKVRQKTNMKHIGIIEEIDDSYQELIYYKVRFPDCSQTISGNSLLEYHEQITLKENLVSGHFGSYHDFQKAITYLKLHNSDSIQNNIYSFNTSRTIFYEYQFKPLMKFISSYKRRLLICDEVGLGKTVEAGLVLKELEARKEIRNVLIVVPANLREKWRWEMQNRFMESFNIIKKNEFEKLINGDDTISKKYKQQRFIVSLESIRGKEMLITVASSDVKWDLLIVDEAHSLRNLTQQHKVIKAMSFLSNSILFLTATPLQTSKNNLFNILNILDEQQFPYLESFDSQLTDNEPIVRALNYISQTPPKIYEAYEELTSVRALYKENMIFLDLLGDLANLKTTKDLKSISIDSIVNFQRSLSELQIIGDVYTRTKKRDVHFDRPNRVTKTIMVAFSEKEKNLYNELIEAVKQDLKLNDSGGYLLPLFNIQRMLSSSLHAHKDTLNQRYNIIEHAIDFLEESDSDAHPHQVFDDVHTNNKTQDSKLNNLVELISKLNIVTRKVIIFAFYKTTLIYLSKQFSDRGIKTYTISGNVHIKDRGSVIASFQNCTEFSILLSSRVGSEGIDLQFCDTIINYDLPWNPMEIEQRIGRVDRIGQKSSTINIFNYGTEDTIDDSIILKLYDRIKLFEDSIGSLEPIIGEIISEITNDIFYKDITEAEKLKRWFEKEKVIINKMKVLNDLEEKAGELMSMDYYYEHEIRSIINKKRYISPEQLFQYVSGFIREKLPDSIVKYDFLAQEGEITLCAKFRRQILFTKYEIDLGSTYYPNKKVTFTLDSNYAFEHPNTQFITIMHPLVSYITEQYDLDPNELFNCHYFHVTRNDLHELSIDLDIGYYFYFVYLATIESNEKKNSILMPIILNEDLSPIGDNEFCEQVLGGTLEKGIHNIQGISCNDKVYLNNAYQKAENEFKDRFHKYFQRFKVKHDMVINRNIESKMYNFQRRLSILQTELNSINQMMHLSEGTLFRKRMLEAKINKLSSEFDDEMLPTEAARECHCAFEEPRLGGVFEVL